ncbi:hypothetical protein BH10CHL1_BH10CHL1_21030 [soil metagenome]
MDAMKRGWQLGGYVGSRLAVVYALLAALLFYLQIGADGGLAAVWQPDKLVVAQLLGTGLIAVILTPLLALIPIGIAWLAGSIAGWLTGLLAWLFSNRTVARWWGMFCFSIPPLVFHTAAALRPHVVLGEHWLNSYWFWVGLPSLICVLVGGWVGTQLAGRAQIVGVNS